MIESEIGNILLNYGPLGAWTIWLLFQHARHTKTIVTAIDNNTQALTEFKYKIEGIGGHNDKDESEAKFS